MSKLEPAQAIPTYENSTHGPQETPDALKFWWYRDIEKVLFNVDFSYLPFRVYVKDRMKGEKGEDILTVNLVHESAPQEDIKVNLPIDPIVWPDLPSTAQLVDIKHDPSRRYGFLFMERSWAKAKNLERFAEPTGNQKWPPAGNDLPYDDVDFERVRRAMEVPALREKLLKVLDDSMSSMPL